MSESNELDDSKETGLSFATIGIGWVCRMT